MGYHEFNDSTETATGRMRTLAEAGSTPGVGEIDLKLPDRSSVARPAVFE